MSARETTAQWGTTMVKSALVAIGIIAFSIALPATAQQPQIKRTPLQTVDFPQGYSTISGIAELSPGASTGHHNHPGIESGYVLEGEFILLVDGKPDQHLKVGDSWQVAATVPHGGRNTSDKIAKLLVVYVVEKGKPVATLFP
jgi:quercetin dioxygenase-like cupin family protein